MTLTNFAKAHIVCGTRVTLPKITHEAFVDLQDVLHVHKDVLVLEPIDDRRLAAGLARLGVQPVDDQFHHRLELLDVIGLGVDEFLQLVVALFVVLLVLFFFMNEWMS